MTELSDLVEAISELGYAVEAVDDDELEVQLSGDAPSRPRPTAVRLAGDADEDARMLMLSTSYEFGAASGGIDDLRLAASEATQYLVLGHFEVDDDGSLHLRYSMLLDNNAKLPITVLAQVFALVDHQQVRFGDYLQLVCTGEQDLAGFADLVAAGEASNAL